MSTIPGYVTVKEAAEFLGVDESQVRRYCIGTGQVKLPAEKVAGSWVIREKDLKQFKPAAVGNPNLKKN